VSARRSGSLLLALVPLSALACLPAHYQTTQWLPGDPPTPAMHAERVSLRDLHHTAGEVDGPHESMRRATVTRAGLTTTTISDPGDQTILLAVRVAARPPVEVLDMVWSPAIAPRCAGGHPALAILVDAEGELNSSLAVRPQVHWERPVVLTGEQVLSGRFDDDPPLLHSASVVDVRLIWRDGTTVREECVRVPITGPGVAY
jgi:hypothetical protein